MKRQKSDERVLPLGPVLESAVMGALISGKLSLKSVKAMELSKIGQAFYKVMREHGEQVSLKTLKIAATEVHGIEKDELKEYIDGLVLDSDIASTLQTLRRKRVVNSLVNEATQQIASGEYSLLPMRSILDAHHEERQKLVAASEDMEHVTPPQGLAIKALPRIYAATPGIYGTWVIGGEPKAGKSTLTLQIALAVAKNERPVLYYDFELGAGVLKYHIDEALQGNKELIKRATSRLYIRSSIHTLESDLDAIREPCLVVVDSIQSVPASVAHRRESIESWVHKLDSLKQHGHHVIMVSEINRSHYGDPSGSAFKESGEIEYKADLACCLILPDPNNSSVVDFHILYNRHKKKRGLVAQLERVNSWWFKERGSP